MLIQEIVEMLLTANPKAVSDIYGFLSDRLDRENEISSPLLREQNEEVRHYLGEILSVLGPDAPAPL
jgi:hypothetical protein